VADLANAEMQTSLTATTKHCHVGEEKNLTKVQFSDLHEKYRPHF